MTDLKNKLELLQDIINQAQVIVIIQADNPDSDSLGSALALEHILGDLGKTIELYCGVDMPAYLHYMSGWDRVSKDLSTDFDASILVDASTMTLLEKLQESGQVSWLASKPNITLDHHEIVENPVTFARVIINEPTASSTGELIYRLAKELKLNLTIDAQTNIMSAILGDTQGLSNQLASPYTYRVMAEMVEAGVSRVDLEEQRRKFSKMPAVIYSYKADLIKQTEIDESGSVAVVLIPHEEIKSYSPLYNPAPLIQNDMLQIEGIEVAIVIKSYNSGKLTGAIRTNPSSPIAAKLADHFGGGGHLNASGFKIDKNADTQAVKAEIVALSQQMLKDLNNENI